MPPLRSPENKINEVGKILVIMGLALAACGALLWAGLGRFFGKLPGDLNVTRGHLSFHFPLVTCLVMSGLLSLAFWLFRR